MKAYKITATEHGYKFKALFMNGKYYGDIYIAKKYSHITDIEGWKSDEMKDIVKRIEEVYVNQDMVNWIEERESDRLKYLDMLKKAAGKKKLDDIECYDLIAHSIPILFDFIFDNLEP